MIDENAIYHTSHALINKAHTQKRDRVIEIYEHHEFFVMAITYYYTIPVRPVTHFKLQCVTIHNLLMGNIALVIRSAIQLHRLNIDIFTAYSRSQDRKSFAFAKCIFTSGNIGVPISYLPLIGSTG